MHHARAIVPRDVLDRLAADRSLHPDARRCAADTARICTQMRALRRQSARLAGALCHAGGHLLALASSPEVAVSDCRRTRSLPGAPVPAAAASPDPVARRVHELCLRVAGFYAAVFGRNSLDDAGMTLASSIHFGRHFDNALWLGGQLLFGDGDGRLFANFAEDADVVAHELTHGVTQFSLQPGEEGEAGGLGESLADCFAAMFRQWEAGDDAAGADWRIGTGLLGPDVRAQGFTCLRDMAAPGDPRALAAQPEHHARLTPGMDPHAASGPPNLAFCLACKAAGGRSWEGVGQVWYEAMAMSGPRPGLSMSAFANLTRQVAARRGGARPALGAAIDAAWRRVGL